VVWCGAMHSVMLSVERSFCEQSRVVVVASKMSARESCASRQHLLHFKQPPRK
jgi:hypothetical protein